MAQRRPARPHAIIACAALSAALAPTAPLSPPGSGMPCQTFADYSAVCQAISAECCDEVTESCFDGVPASCNAGCAEVLAPALAACTAKGGWLTQPSLAATRASFTSATALCAAGGPPPPLPCATAGDFERVSRVVTSECCDEAVESCSGGIPSSCNAGCAAVLLPAQAVCTADNGYLARPSLRTVADTLARAAALCSTSQCIPPTTLPCSTFKEYAVLSQRVTEACGDIPNDCSTGSEACAAVILPVLAACTGGAGILASSVLMQIERDSLEQQVQRCAPPRRALALHSPTTLTSCDSYEEYAVFGEQVLSACCSKDAGTEGHCASGIPTTCPPVGPCQSALLALNRTCASVGNGFLLQPAMAATRAAYANASSRCCRGGELQRITYANCSESWNCTITPPSPAWLPVGLVKIHSHILGVDPQRLALVEAALPEVVQGGRWALCYDSRTDCTSCPSDNVDGKCSCAVGQASFHGQCDGHARTVVLGQNSLNFTFGGFAMASWRCPPPCSGGYDYNSQATADFIFRLQSGSNVGAPGEVYRPRAGGDPGYHARGPAHWPSWGMGFDLTFGFFGGLSSGGYCTQGRTYEGHANEACGGSFNWGQTEMEVWYHIDN